MTLEGIPFNRKTEDTFSRSGKINFNMVRRRTSFDTDAVALMEARPHMFVHFVVIGEDCFLAVNDDSTGYQLTRTAKRAGLRINNAKFIRWFFSKNKITSESAVFIIMPHEKLEWHGHPLFEMVKVVS